MPKRKKYGYIKCVQIWMRIYYETKDNEILNNVYLYLKKIFVINAKKRNRYLTDEELQNIAHVAATKLVEEIILTNEELHFNSFYLQQRTLGFLPSYKYCNTPEIAIDRNHVKECITNLIDNEHSINYLASDQYTLDNVIAKLDFESSVSHLYDKVIQYVKSGEVANAILGATFTGFNFARCEFQSSTMLATFACKTLNDMRRDYHDKDTSIVDIDET